MIGPDPVVYPGTVLGISIEDYTGRIYLEV